LALKSCSIAGHGKTAACRLYRYMENEQYIDVYDMMEDMGFSSREDYEKFLNGTDDKPRNPNVSKTEVEEIGEGKPMYVLILHACKDAQVVGIYSTRRKAEKDMDDLTVADSEMRNHLMIREGSLK